MNIESLSLSSIISPLALGLAAASLRLALRYRRERDDARAKAARVWNQIRDVQRNLPELLNRIRTLEEEDVAAATSAASHPATSPAISPPHEPFDPDPSEPVILKFRRRRECR